MFKVAFKRDRRTARTLGFTKRGAAVCVIVCALGAPARAATRVALIDGGDLDPKTRGERWCSFLNNNGYECTLFPMSGPTSSLEEFAVVIDMSNQWADPTGSLSQFLRTGKGVIVWGAGAETLGIDNDPIVQAWIGANEGSFGTEGCVTTSPDPILGDIPAGTEIAHCGFSLCRALRDTNGHPEAKTLARFNVSSAPIAILRNRWEGGRSIYLSDVLIAGVPLHDEIFLRAVAELSIRIPTISAWGCFLFALSAVTAGSIVMKRRAPRHPRLTEKEER